jgi:Lrp/AsnC family transcriptional regulator, leucine-responsive regulatory protein
MEEIDRKILRLMVADGRMSYTDLGKATGLSTSAAHQRVRRLEQRGIIKGYRAIVDEDALGLPLTAFISVKPFDPAAPDDVPARLADLPEVESCHSVAGEENYILKVRVATPGALESLLARIRTAANVSTRTTIVLSTPFEGRAALAPADPGRLVGPGGDGGHDALPGPADTLADADGHLANAGTVLGSDGPAELG